jgi:hypothetical protein
MNNWWICCFFTHILLGILIFKGLTGRRLYKFFGVKGLNDCKAQLWLTARIPFTQSHHKSLENVLQLWVLTVAE